MTALIVVREVAAGLAHIVSDGGATDERGHLSHRVNKVVQIPHLNAIAALRGALLMLPFVGQALWSQAEDFEDLKARCPDILRSVIDEKAPVLRYAADGADFDLVVAGIAADGTPDTFFLANHSKSGSVPWQIKDLADLTLLPGNGETLASIHPVERLPSGQVDMRAFGARMMEMQRRERIARPSGTDVLVPAACAFVQLTTVSLDKIETSIIHRWADEVGQVIR